MSACQLLAAIRAQVRAGNYYDALQNADQAERLANRAGQFTQDTDYATLQVDLGDVLSTDSSTDLADVNADLAALAGDCRA